MKDRIPTYAGRIRLTPVENQSNIYDMERADEPIQEGTPLNVKNLLSDETARKLGLTEEATVNDAIDALNQNKAKAVFGSYVGTGNPNTNLTSKKTLTFDFTPKIVFIQQIGSTTNFGHGALFAYGCGRQLYITHLNLDYTVSTVWTETTLTLRGEGDDRTDARAVFNGETYNYIYVAIG